MNEEIYDIIVVGGGPAGLTAGIYAARSGLKALIVEKKLAGGLLLEAPFIENYPGFEGLNGSELAELMKKHAKQYLPIREFEEVTSIEQEGALFRIFTLRSAYRTRSVVFATGTEHMRLNIRGERRFLGRGVSYCVTCDGYLFKGKRALVVGGGNSGAVAALFLSGICEKVYIVEFMPHFMCEAAYRKRLSEAKVDYIMNHKIVEIFGDDVVKGVKIINNATGEVKSLDVNGVFIYVGLKPQSRLAEKLGVKLDKKGYIEVDKNQRTNIPLVYAAGDVTGGKAQVVTAAAQGAVAALSAYEDLTKL